VISETISHYRIISKLGAGGMGEVYLAEDTKLDRKVAIKFLPSTSVADDKAKSRLFREAQAAAKLDHPNICAIHEVSEEAGRSFIVMQYVEGETLGKLIERKPLELRESLDIAVQVADALAEAHAHNIIHRDIKPQNIMITARGQVKVLDFGLAKLVRDRSPLQSEAETASLLTESGAIVGTVPYMSPEQVRGEELDARSDIFSFGVVLYEMVTGRRPFSADSAAATFSAILTHIALPLARYSPEAPAELERIVSKALAKDREERYQTAKDLFIDLRRLKQRQEIDAEMERSTHKASSVAPEIGVHQPSTVSAEQPVVQSSEAAQVRTTSSAEYLIGEVKRHKLGVALSLAALIVAVAAIAYVPSLIRKRPQTDQPPTQRKLSRLTFDPGLQSEPTWSPDGRLIAYGSNRSGNFDIWVQQVGGGDPVQVTKSPAHDWQPDWSPDGNNIVFRSERDGGGLYVVPALGGNERKVSSFGFRPRWSPNGSQILFYSSLLQGVTAPPKVYVVALDGNAPREVQAEFLAEFGSLRVAWHPDGLRVSLWGRHRKLGLGFWTMSVTGGTPTMSELSAKVEEQIKEATVSFDDFLWAPSGHILYFEGTSQGVRNLWRVEVDPQTLRWVAGPERLTTGPGLDTDIALSPNGRKLAFTTRTESTRIWSLPFNAATGQTKGAGQPVTAAGMDAWNFDLTRDGKKLAFFAHRAGKQELWEKSLEDGRETLLLASDGFGRRHPRWSRDGLILAYLRTRPTNPERNQFESSMVLLAAGGGDEQVFTSPGLGGIASDWSADGKWVLGNFGRQTVGQLLICLFPIAAAPQAETQMRVVTGNSEYNLYHARFSPDERWIHFNAVKATDARFSSIYVVPASGGEWTRITEGKYWDDKPRWSPDGKAIYFASTRGGFVNVWGIHFDAADGKSMGEPFRVTNFESPGRMISPQLGSMQIALVADRLVLPIMEVSGSVWVLENVDR
jgi:serine/threonine protein kinase/sugar lactone lactonase YvrE